MSVRTRFPRWRVSWPPLRSPRSPQAARRPTSLTLMPRDSGKLYQGVAEDAGGAEGTMSVTIEGRTYAGTWVEVVSDRATAHVTAGFGSRRFWGGGLVLMDNTRAAAR